MSKFSMFWWWFPFSLTGIRALLLFISCLTIFILRIAQMHVGKRSTTSKVQIFWQTALSRRAVQTIIWYTLSAWLYCEVYIFSTAEGANLAWVDPGRSYERARLNERPVMLRSLFMCLAAVQSGLHLYGDYDRVPVPSDKVKAVVVTPEGQEKPCPSGIFLLADGLKNAANPIFQRSLTLTISTALVGPLAYFTILRRPAWALAHNIGKTFFTLSKSTKPSGLTDLGSLMVRFIGSGLLLVLLWEISNTAFSISASEEPLKNGQPLTSDAKDPNGSLISGLKAKREIPKAMAFRELALITAKFEERRKTLFQDLDRRGGSTWSQVSSLCLTEIQAITKSIQTYEQPSVPTAIQQAPVQTLPKMSRPLQQENILSPAPKANGTLDLIANGLGAVAKSYGQSPVAGNVAGNVVPKAQKMLEYGSDKVLTKEQKQQLDTSGLMKQADEYFVQLIRSPLGVPFRQTFRRKINAIVFGQPFSHAGNIINAIQSLCRLTCASLREDSMGQVQKDVSSIIRVLVSTIQTVQGLVDTLPPHWTDVDFDQKRRVKEVDELLDTLKDGLEQVLVSFGEYADALGLGRAEMRAAKAVLNKKPEMEIRRS